MPLPLSTITASLWSRIATDSAGSAVRALLSSTSAVYTAAQAEGGTPGTPPFLVWREGPVAGTGDVMRRTFGAWWVYVPRADTRLQAQIIEAIETAYPQNAIADGMTEIGPIGQAAPDGALGGLWARPVTVSYLRRA